MSGFMDLGATKSTTLSNISNQLNPSILQETQLYKSKNPTNIPSNGNVIKPQQQINAQNLVNDFQQKTMNQQVMQQPMKQPIQQPINAPININNNNNQTHKPQIQIHQPNIIQPPNPMINNFQHPTMFNPMMQFQQMDSMQMMQNQLFNMKKQMEQLNVQQNNVKKQTQNDEEKIKTSDEVPKTAEEVEEELNNLNPSNDELQQINNLLTDTQNDPKMANSQFMKFLRNIKDKNESKTSDNNSLSEAWKQDFNSWQNNNTVDSMNWDSYLETINPNKPKTYEYKFSENNHYNNNNNGNYMDYFKEGQRLMKEGNLNEAILAFESCLKISPKRSEAWRLLGQCHADNENEQGGITCFMKCHELDPYDLDALLQLGVSYTNEIDPFHALKYLKSWIANHPDYSILADQLESMKPDNNNNKGMYGGWMGSKDEHKKVANLFIKAVNINDKDIDLHIVLGVLYNITSEYNKAEDHFKKAIMLNPKDPSLWNKLGATQANGNKPKDAMKAYGRALKLKPNYVRALSNLGIAFANQDLHREACQSYLASLKLNNNADGVWDHLQMSLMHLNRSDLVNLCKSRDVNLFKKHFDF